MSQQIAALIFAVAIIGLEVLVMIIRGRGWGPMSTRIVGLSLVIVAAVVLAMADMPNDQRSPVYTLLGVIAGYLAGRPGGEAADS
jgi:hypothetical protein